MTLQLRSSINTELANSEAVQANQLQQDLIDDSKVNEAIDEDQLYRSSTYALIASLLRSPPDKDMLIHVAQLNQSQQDDSDELLIAMSTLGLSAKLLTPSAIDDEYHDLFIGLGKGEVVPYASWYLTGFLMEKPLSDLRDDLTGLGYQREESVSEPEDHAAALCEVMSMMIGEGRDLATQKQFFNSHMANWFDRFFSDLGEAKSAIFYKSLARFGAAVTALEKDYFSMQS